MRKNFQGYDRYFMGVVPSKECKDQTPYAETMFLGEAGTYYNDVEPWAWEKKIFMHPLTFFDDGRTFKEKESFKDCW